SSRFLFVSCPQLCFLIPRSLRLLFFFFFHAPATTEIYTLSLHDALPISKRLIPSIISTAKRFLSPIIFTLTLFAFAIFNSRFIRSEEHTSELQSRFDLVCRLLLEKKKNNTNLHTIH